VFPEWVGTDRDGFKTVNLTGIEALTVESVRALKQENDDLRGRVRALEMARRPPLFSGFGEGALGFGFCAIAGALLVAGRRRVRD
jgi:hypothetical protein